VALNTIKQTPTINNQNQHLFTVNIIDLPMDGFLWFSTGYTALEINNRDFTKRVFIAFLITTNIVKHHQANTNHK
jgi:hypothetical protein